MTPLLSCSFPQLGLIFSHPLHSDVDVTYVTLLTVSGVTCTLASPPSLDHVIRRIPVSAPDLASAHPLALCPLDLLHATTHVETHPPHPPLFQAGLLADYDPDEVLSLSFSALTQALTTAWTSPFVRRRPRAPPPFRWHTSYPPRCSHVRITFQPAWHPPLIASASTVDIPPRTDYRLAFGPPHDGYRSVILAHSPQDILAASFKVPYVKSDEESLAYALPHLPFSAFYLL